jgi:hypothetical protein
VPKLFRLNRLTLSTNTEATELSIPVDLVSLFLLHTAEPLVTIKPVVISNLFLREVNELIETVVAVAELMRFLPITTLLIPELIPVQEESLFLRDAILVTDAQSATVRSCLFRVLKQEATLLEIADVEASFC